MPERKLSPQARRVWPFEFDEIVTRLRCITYQMSAPCRTIVTLTACTAHLQARTAITRYLEPGLWQEVNDYVAPMPQDTPRAARTTAGQTAGRAAARSRDKGEERQRPGCSSYQPLTRAALHTIVKDVSPARPPRLCEPGAAFEVCANLGHASLSNTSLYLHVDDDRSLVTTISAAR
ncbi:hypothetical protein GCT13_40690 [Paraburkholderia sp. CNPSo 3157]|uniref:Uncharacterized protein n=1 Tax=Paraburkholderia franconis TaxID=2654983 RepID=A0A7X1NJQ6_9BURK|nr:hypothetical protein [Paraburkholderia franconis]MPW22941.1 hypothetical protein [Paraburkholderia franconis]